MVDYKEFLKLPEIKAAFNDMFEEKRKYFRDISFSSNGFNKEYLEAASIKMSLITTDLYFSEMHRKKISEIVT
jgi:hypothetical protein